MTLALPSVTPHISSVSCQRHPDSTGAALRSHEYCVLGAVKSPAMVYEGQIDVIRITTVMKIGNTRTTYTPG